MPQKSKTVQQKGASIAKAHASHLSQISNSVLVPDCYELYCQRVDGRTECRKYFYQGVVTRSSWSWSWRRSPDEITVARQFGFSLCAVPPRSFFVLIYEGPKLIRIRRSDEGRCRITDARLD